MKFKTTYKARHKLYQTHLSKISGIKFTFREIDVIACVMHSRGDKKIAEILSISPRTVSNHAYNIMTRLNCNSKDQIIDFIEKAGLVKYFRQYYSCLLLHVAFENSLIRIGKLLDKNIITHKICLHDNRLKDNPFMFKQLQSHLKLANIMLMEITLHDIKHDNTSIQNNISILESPLLLHEELEQIVTEDYYKQCHNIILTLLKYHKIENSILASIKSIYKDFDDEYQAICNSWEMNTNNLDLKPSGIRALSMLQNYKLVLVIILILLLGGIVFTTTSLRYSISWYNKQESYISSAKLAEIKNLNEAIEKYADLISPSNARCNEEETNAYYMAEVKKIYEQINNDTILYDHFLSTNVQLTELQNYISMSYSLINYYLYNTHNASEAYINLQKLERLIQQYICNQDKRFVTEDFSDPVIIHELNRYGNLSALYAKVTYSLSRMYLFQVIDPMQAKKYADFTYQLALSNKLYEGYLSVMYVRNVIIREIIVEKPFKHKEELFDIASGKITLKDVIKSYDMLIHDNNTYKRNYDHKGNYDTIIPAEDPLCVSDAYEHQAKTYKTLMLLEKSQEHFDNAITSITNTKIAALKRKKISVILCTLCKILKEGYDLQLSLNKSHKAQILGWIKLSQELQNNSDENFIKTIENGDMLKMIESIAMLTRNNSGKWEWPRADACDVLSFVYTKFNNDKKAKQYADESKQINAKLSRK